MLFNSFSFLLFYPFVTLLYYVLPHKHRWWWLLAASAVFYAAFVPAYLLILAAVIVIDYAAGLYIQSSHNAQHRLVALWCSLAANIGILAVFKYYNFFIYNINHWLINTEQAPLLPYLDYLLPIGLSFHTFQALSYTIEVYRGRQAAERHLGIYALYVLFYPQLVAGPIERPQNMLQQFRSPHPYLAANLYAGCRLMLWGFFKKMVIADRLAIYVGHIYENPFYYHPINVLLAVFFFTIQIYCDFSGYSDIALGAARSMGFRLMTNFNRPYFASNIQVFWQRWHLSLSTWFRDYIYLPLGGSHTTRWRWYRNITLIFLLSGLWHGANWTYLLWGAMHTAYMLVYMTYKSTIWYISPRTLLVGRCLTFAAVMFAFAVFRAPSLAVAGWLWQGLCGANVHGTLLLFIENTQKIVFNQLSYIIAAVSICFMFWVEGWQNTEQSALDHRPTADLLLHASVLLWILTLGVFRHDSFIYFQF